MDKLSSGYASSYYVVYMDNLPPLSGTIQSPPREPYRLRSWVWLPMVALDDVPVLVAGIKARLDARRSQSSWPQLITQGAQ